ncbi:hypothetical protein [Alteribacter natronophilus]|uniref:hypothetical protein n=1 Tax=Alteribacter natronophilus TaxID=2583810 RepID=UPI001486F9C9|nr:hypothetical protein [Alteribacter natronophilus]
MKRMIFYAIVSVLLVINAILALIQGRDHLWLWLAVAGFAVASTFYVFKTERSGEA